MTTVLLSEVGRGEVARRPTIVGVSLSPKEVGARIARAREEKQPKPWSQLDIALALGVSPSTIYRWEKGKLPSVTELIRLTDVLDQPLNYLAEPPERQAEISDLRDRLATLEESVVASREAALEILASIHDQLVRIERQLAARDVQAKH